MNARDINLDRITLPDLANVGPFRVVSELVDGERVVNTALVPGGASAASTARALRNARVALASVENKIDKVTISVDRHSLAQLEAAAAKRARRTAKRR